MPADAASRALELYRAVDDEALSRIDLGIATTSAIVVLLAGAGVLRALSGNTALEEFDRGVTAYQRHEFVRARDAFARLVAAEPTAPDAWANLGTAAWASADTARSVAGWQRALRLEPLAGDMRDRTELVHALPMGSAGWVAPVPANWLFNLAALIWCASWFAATASLVRRRPLAVRRLAVAGTLAGGLAVGGLVLAESASGRQLAVVRQTASLSDDPALGGDLGPTAIVGEVVRVRGRQGAWTHVQLDDGRDGWLQNAALISLDARDGALIAGD